MPVCVCINYCLACKPFRADLSSAGQRLIWNLFQLHVWQVTLSFLSENSDFFLLEKQMFTYVDYFK